jgi:uncharacterized protein
MSLEFEWDPKKAQTNRASHGIDFEEALTVFRDPLARIFDDEGHSQTEPREIIIGHSAKQCSGLFHGSREQNSSHQYPQGDAG